MTLDAGWQNLGRDKQQPYWAPIALRCSSVGPGPIPVGSSIRLDADSRFVAGASVDSARMITPGGAATLVDVKAITTREDDSHVIFTMALDEQIAAEAVLEIRLKLNEASDIPSVVGGLKLATAAFIPAPGSERTQRDTGATLSANLTASGRSLAPRAQLGAI